jgi:GNAT superfamily N-acetyltransferase
MIRPGHIDDLPEIARIRTSVTENHLSMEQMAELGITAQSIAADMTAGHLACWVAMEGGKIAGFSLADGRDACVFGLFMDAAHERMGHGSALLAACEDWLRQQGHSSARLTTGRGTKALAFYLRRGWVESDDVDEHFPEDAVLVKAL